MRKYAVPSCVVDVLLGVVAAAGIALLFWILLFVLPGCGQWIEAPAPWSVGEGTCHLEDAGIYAGTWVGACRVSGMRDIGNEHVVLKPVMK